MGELEKRTEKITRETFLNIEKTANNFIQAKETSKRSLEIHKEELMENYLAERDVNIIPFRCNCGQKIYGESELEYILDHLEDCKENGVCKYLMWLNEEWDNMPIDTQNNRQSYLKIVDGTISKDVEENTTASEGITRTSVLFCRRGGLIIPLTSGQEYFIDLETSFIFNCE